MAACRLLLVLAAAAAAAAVAAVAAQTRLFPRPSYGPYRLDWCLTPVSCGLPAADTFCRWAGYNRADAFDIDHKIGDVTPTWVAGSGKICDGSYCDGFTYIRCTNGLAMNHFTGDTSTGGCLC